MQEYRRTQKKLIIIMVGLPARGKTHISYKLNRYLNWIGYNSQIFSIKTAQAQKLDYNIELEIDPENHQAQLLRQELADQAAKQLIEFLQGNGDIAIYNALCQTKNERSQAVQQFNSLTIPYQMFWIESICQDMDVIMNNITDSKVAGEQMTAEHFLSSLKKVEQISQTISDDENHPYMKIINIGKSIKVHCLDGYLQSKVVSFMLNLHITHRAIYLCRSGQSQYSLEGRLGGDSELSEVGIKYSNQLAEYFEKELLNHREVRLFTSTMKRGMQTMKPVGETLKQVTLCTKNLDEIDYGICDGMTYKQLAEKFPQQIKDRANQQLDFKYPRGESFLDVIHRVEPIIYEIERSKQPVIVVAHVAVLKCLYTYFHYNNLSEVPQIEIPEDTIIKLMPIPYAACRETRISLQQKQQLKQQS